MTFQAGNRVRILDTAFDEDDGDELGLLQTRGEIGTVYRFIEGDEMYQVYLDRADEFEFGEPHVYSDEIEFINVPENIPDGV